MSNLTQVQAEEQCRILRLKRNAKVQEADRSYREEISRLFREFQEAVKKMDEEIIHLKSQIAQVRYDMNVAWDNHYNLHKDDEKEPVMGIIVNPFKLKISELQLQMEAIINTKNHLRDCYKHNRALAAHNRECINRDAEDEYINARTLVMEQVVSRSEQLSDK